MLTTFSRAIANDGSYPEFVECVVKETMRMFPVCGNSTIRTPTGCGGVTVEVSG